MFIPQSYTLAVILCIITMICWGSWGNTQKLAGKSWRFELFYWDYVFGIVLFSLLLGFTMGSTGESGRGFVQDIKQADSHNILNALFGGIIFNASNILLVAAMAGWQWLFLLVLELHLHWELLSIMYMLLREMQTYFSEG